MPTCSVTEPARSRPTSVVVARAVATASTAHSAMSSSSAAPRMMLANRVCRIRRSKKMREITGIEVTATAMARTRSTDASSPAGPVSRSSGSKVPMPSAMKKGRGVPIARIHAVGLRFSCPSTRRTSLPEMNINSRRPSQ